MFHWRYSIRILSLLTRVENVAPCQWTNIAENSFRYQNRTETEPNRHKIRLKMVKIFPQFLHRNPNRRFFWEPEPNRITPKIWTDRELYRFYYKIFEKNVVPYILNAKFSYFSHEMSGSIFFLTLNALGCVMGWFYLCQSHKFSFKDRPQRHSRSTREGSEPAQLGGPRGKGLWPDLVGFVTRFHTNSSRSGGKFH